MDSIFLSRGSVAELSRLDDSQLVEVVRAMLARAAGDEPPVPSDEVARFVFETFVDVDDERRARMSAGGKNKVDKDLKDLKHLNDDKEVKHLKHLKDLDEVADVESVTNEISSVYTDGVGVSPGPAPRARARESILESNIESAHARAREEHGARSPQIVVTNNVEAVCRAWEDGGLGKRGEITPRRAALIEARVKEYGLDAVLATIRRAAASSFLRDGSARGWRPSLDWAMNKENYIKIIEGNYDNNESGTNKKRQSAVVADADVYLARIAERTHGRG